MDKIIQFASSPESGLQKRPGPQDVSHLDLSPQPHDPTSADIPPSVPLRGRNRRRENGDCVCTFVNPLARTVSAIPADAH